MTRARPGLADGAGPPGQVVVDGDVGSQPAHGRHLGRSARRSDDRRAEAVGELDDESADSPGRGGDQDHVVRGEGRDVEQSDGGGTGDDHGDGCFVTQSVRDPVHGGHVGDGQLGVTARPAVRGHHVGADPAPVHVGPDRRDHTGHLPTEDRREFGQRRSDRQPLPHGRLDLVDARGPDRDENLTRPRHRIGHRLVAEVLSGPELVQYHGAHVRSFRWINRRTPTL